MGKKHFLFLSNRRDREPNADTGNRTPNSGVKGSGANHYPRAPALVFCDWTYLSHVAYIAVTAPRPHSPKTHTAVQPINKSYRCHTRSAARQFQYTYGSGRFHVSQIGLPLIDINGRLSELLAEYPEARSAHPASRGEISHMVPLDMKGCICHFTKWQIHPFISKGICEIPPPRKARWASPLATISTKTFNYRRHNVSHSWPNDLQL